MCEHFAINTCHFDNGSFGAGVYTLKNTRTATKSKMMTPESLCKFLSVFLKSEFARKSNENPTASELNIMIAISQCSAFCIDV